MSSRLLTMKFMQRAAASAPTSPGTPDQKSAKRQKLSDGTFHTPSPKTPSAHDAIVQKAIADEEAKRQSAIDREAARYGETKWYLDVKPNVSQERPAPVRIISAGFSALDTKDGVDESSEDDDDAEQPVLVGRRTFGQPIAQPDKTVSDDDEDSVSDDDPDDPSDTALQNGHGDEIRAKLKAKRKAKDDKAAQMAGERRSKEIKLNKLSSISGGGRAAPLITCHACGEQGHIKAKCPNSRKHSRRTL